MGDVIYLKNLKVISGSEKWVLAIPKDILYYIKNYFKLRIVKNILSQDNLDFMDFNILMNEWDYYMLYNIKPEHINSTYSSRITPTLFLINAGIRIDLYYPLAMVESKVPGFIQVYNQIEFKEEY